ncbi:hypothetical protein ACJQWK_11019 [Exserohilum turcicum]
MAQRDFFNGNGTTAAPDRNSKAVVLSLLELPQPVNGNGIESIYHQKKNDFMKNNGHKENRAKELAHKRILSDDAHGMSLTDILALSGFQTKYSLRCDHCKDENSCRFYKPEIAYSRKMTPKCHECYGTKHVCTFHAIANTTDLVDAIRNFEAFKRHVPCNRCYARQKECDNRAGVCERCEAEGEECVRETCENGSEPGDESRCHKDCDKAHEDDGYTNISETPRGKGCNVRLRLRKDAQADRIGF